MGKEINITNGDILRFYADKGEKGCELTEKYMSRYPLENKKKSNKYVGVVGTFQNEGRTGEEDDRCFYKWLIGQNYSEMLSLSDLAKTKTKEDLMEDFLKCPDMITQSPLIEKWHLYVSFYAFEEFWASEKNPNGRWLTSQSIFDAVDNPKTGIFNQRLNCSHSLWLWLYEASVLNRKSKEYKEVEKWVLNKESIDIKKLRDETIKNILIWKNRNQILKKDFLSPTCSNQYYLRLNRTLQCLEVYEKADSCALQELYPLRKDFDVSDYTLFGLKKMIPCIFGGEGRMRTPVGIFRIEHTSKLHEEYVSSYHPQHDQVKFFGYLAVFEDYFIHSDMYLMDAASDTFQQKEPLSEQDVHTSGCIRVLQEELDWLVEHVSEGTTIET